MATKAAPLSVPAPPDDNEPQNLGEVLDKLGQPAKLPLQSGAHVPLGVYQAISMITAELGALGIAKEKEATEGGRFKYRGIDQVYAALNGLLVKHSLVILPRYRDRVETERRTSRGNAIFDVTLTGEFDFVCITDGSKVTVTTFGEAFDTGDKATNKAMSVAYKYAAFQTFCIPVQGENTEDTDATQDHEIAPSGSKQKPKESREDMEARARKNYSAAENMITSCATEAELEKVWPKIDWDNIPKGWHPHLIKVRQDHSKAIARPRHDQGVTQAFNPPVFDTAGMDDDIPF